MQIISINAIVNGHSHLFDCIGGYLDKEQVLKYTNNTMIHSDNWQWQDEHGNVIEDGKSLGWGQPIPPQKFFLTLKVGHAA